MGVEEEKIEKSYKLKVWRRFQIQNFSTYKEGQLTSNLGLTNVGSLTFCIYGVLSNIFCFTKKLFTKNKFEKCCEAKKMHKGHISGRRKNLNQKKIKIESVAFIKKNSSNQTSKTQKSVFFFFNFVLWEVFLHAVSAYCKL